MITTILAAACTLLPMCSPTVTTNCATPTPTARWDQVPDVDRAGYKVYYRLTGSTTWILLAAIDCQTFDSNGDGVDDAKFCQGAELDIPLQRYCPAVFCAAGQSYDFAIKAYDAAGNVSLAFSNVISECFPPIWAGRGTPWN